MIENESASLHDAFGTVMHGLDQSSSPAESDDVAAAHDEVQEWLEARSWSIEAEAPAPHRLVESLAALRHFDFPVTIADFEVRYARDMPNRTSAVETMLIGTVIYERALSEIRHLALEAASARISAEDLTN